MENPLFEGSSSSSSSTTSSPTSSPASSQGAPSNNGDLRDVAVPPATIQMVNIRAHVPVVLDLTTDSNYSQWRRFFDTVFAKFALRHHIAGRTRRRNRTPEWVMNDASVTNWIYTTISRELQTMVMQPDETAFDVWSTLEGLFRDNRATRAVYIEAEFRSLCQGDMTVMQYCGRLKQLADNLRDVGQPVKEDNQVLNMLRGLNPKYGHAISSITAKEKLPTFFQARSTILLEEFREKEKDKNQAAQALFAGHGSSSGAASSGDGASSSGTSSNSGRSNNNNRRQNNRNRQRRQGGNSGGGAGGGSGGGYGARGGSSSSSTAGGSQAPSPWAMGLNPWTGMVQAWPMPFRAPASGVLGPRPGHNPHQAYFAQAPAQPNYFNYAAPPALPPPPSPAATWDQSALMAALNNIGTAGQNTSSGEWVFDSGASSHMASHPGSSHPEGDSAL